MRPRSHMLQLTEVSRRFPQAAGCDALYEVRDEAAGLLAFVALHDLTRGPGFGGIRRLAYASAQDAVTDVVELAEQMTLKTCLAELPAGGAKAVIVDRRGATPEQHAAMYAALGEAIERLGGAFIAGPDVGTHEADLNAVRGATRWVSPPSDAPARSTARGVALAIEAATTHLGLAGAVTGVLGVGSVGAALARELHARGHRIVVADREAERAARLAADLAVPSGDPIALAFGEIGVLAPCALGPFVTHANVAALRARVVCGAANNQLADATLAHALAERDVLYVPDFAVNPGAVIEAVLALRGAPAEALTAAIEAIGPRIAELLAEATTYALTPLEVALGRLAMR